MSGEKTTTQGSQTSQATPQEQAMEQLQLSRLQRNTGNQNSMDDNMYSFINTILKGGALSGNLAGAYGISDAQNQSMVNSSLRSVAPQFQSAGLTDSGLAYQGQVRAAQDTSNANAQFNVGSIQNLLGIASGAGSNMNVNTNQQNSILGGQLAGLRTTNSSGSTIGMNPFLKSFQQSAGQNIAANFNGPNWLSATH